MAAQLIFKKVTKKFASQTVLDNLSFEIQAGEFVFLTGASGAGKTTLIRLIRKELDPTSGQIIVGPFDLAEIKNKTLPQLRRYVGIVFQDFKLLPDRTVAENVALSAEILGWSTEKTRQEVTKVLKLTGLKDKANLFPSQLAGGELQRACLARTVLSEPEIIIADEPTGNLDVATAWQILNLLVQINKLGKTVLVSTHNFEIVNALKKRVLHLEKGRLLSDHKGGYRL